MKLVLNGKNENTAEGATVSQLLVERKVAQPDMVSVEVNGEMLSRDEFDNTVLKENDQVEFLFFMGGGSC